MTRLVNGSVNPGDWVRERPAGHHFQPCYCCLCRPPSGERPVFQVESIVSGPAVDRPYLRLVDEGEFPAEEFELAPSPPRRTTAHTAGTNRVDLRGLPDREALRRLLSGSLG